MRPARTPATRIGRDLNLVKKAISSNENGVPLASRGCRLRALPRLLLQPTGLPEYHPQVLTVSVGTSAGEQVVDVKGGKARIQVLKIGNNNPDAG